MRKMPKAVSTPATTTKILCRHRRRRNNGCFLHHLRAAKREKWAKLGPSGFEREEDDDDDGDDDDDEVSDSLKSFQPPISLTPASPRRRRLSMAPTGRYATAASQRQREMAPIPRVTMPPLLLLP